MNLDSLYYLEDDLPAPCSFQMALDESLFRFSQETGKAVIRFYRWDDPAITFGYSEPFPKERDIAPIRRFTGGGKVEHGDDLTFLLTLPGESTPAALPAEARYQWVHESILKALKSVGYSLTAESLPKPQERGPCFENPVTWDLLSSNTGEKVVGGAQRRSRGSIIHQGSIRLPENLRIDHTGWTGKMVSLLTDMVLPFPEPELKRVHEMAKGLESERYITDEWNRRR